MDALSLLTQRQSHPRLVAPAPSNAALDNIKHAALRVPDHGGLTPWRFIVCEQQGLHKLGALFERSAIDNDKSAAEIARAVQLPLRAPMVIIAIMRFVEHEKVPRDEQFASTGCAVMAMQMAAQAQGFNGIWRTGSYATCETVRAGLELSEQDEIVGFLYLGTPQTQAGVKPTRDSQRYFTDW